MITTTRIAAHPPMRRALRACTLAPAVFAALAAIGILASGFAPADAAAQVSPVAPCAYDDCALRIRAPTLTTPAALVRGRSEEELVQLGFRQPFVASFFVRSDSAYAHARRYDVLYDRGGFMNIAGTVMAIASPIIFPNTSQKIGFTLAGIGLSFWGGLVTNSANDALAQAIWWHNRELEPSTGRR